MRGLICCILILAASIESTFAANYPFRLEQNKNGNVVTLIAVNDGPAPVHYSAWIERWSNVQSSRPWPFNQVAPPYSRTKAAVLYPLNAYQSWSFQFRHQFRPGNPGAIHSPNAIYRLPYPDGLKFRITQSPGQNITTHKDIGSFQAVDINMPEGTPVLAAREGVVIDTENRYGTGAKTEYFSDKANYVNVLHDDGTWAGYAHLKQNGVAVYVGKQVKAGQIIGFSGSSGYSSGPHLHFVVQKNNGQQVISLPFRFYTKFGRPFGPVAGQSHLADYSMPSVPVQQAAQTYRPIQPQANTKAVEGKSNSLAGQIGRMTNPVVTIGLVVMVSTGIVLALLAIREGINRRKWQSQKNHRDGW